MSKFITSDPPYNAGLYPTTAGFLQLAGGVALSSTLTHVTDQLNNLSTLELSTNRIRMNTSAAESRATLQITSIPFTSGNGETNHPVLLFGAHGGSIWAASPNGGTYLGINAVASFPGNFLDFHVNGGASVFSVSNTGVLFLNSPTGTTGNLIDLKLNNANRFSVSSNGVILQTVPSGVTGYVFEILVNGVSRFNVTGTNGIIGGTTIGTSNCTVPNFWESGFVKTWATIAATTAKVTFGSAWNNINLPTSRPSTVGDIYVDTAANILANGDKILAIRV